MGAKRVIWHVGFERILRRRGPPSFEVRSEVPLSEEPPRLDYLLLRKLTPEGEPVDNSAQTLRHLWPRLPRVSVVEYKSPSHPYRSGQLVPRRSEFDWFTPQAGWLGRHAGGEPVHAAGRQAGWGGTQAGNRFTPQAGGGGTQAGGQPGPASRERVDGNAHLMRVCSTLRQNSMGRSPGLDPSRH
jgi:hypothetical protein